MKSVRACIYAVCALAPAAIVKLRMLHFCMSVDRPSLQYSYGAQVTSLYLYKMFPDRVQLVILKPSPDERWQTCRGQKEECAVQYSGGDLKGPRIKTRVDQTKQFRACRYFDNPY